MCKQSKTCERYNFSDAIFVGKAIAIEKGKSGHFETESTTFEIQESFSGNQKKQIKVQNKSGFSCDIEFEKDEIYLVFAHKYENGEFGTGFCNGNLPIEFASEEIANLRKILKSNTAGKLFGVVLGELNQKNKADNRTPVPNVTLNIQEIDTKKNYTVVSDKVGRYEIQVKTGTYKITPVVPDSTKLKFSEEDKIYQLKSRGCVEGYFVLANNSKIKGKVIDADGKPIPNLDIELLTASQKEKSFMWGNSSKSDEKGYFEFNDIPIGEYTLSVNFNRIPQTSSAFPETFYPNTETSKNAKIFEVKLGSIFEEIIFRLPTKLVEKQFDGKVFWADGTLAKDVEIMLEDAEFPKIRAGCDLVMTVEKISDSNAVSASGSFVGLGCDSKTDSSGKFTLSGFVGRNYKVQAEISKKIDGKDVEFVAESTLFSIDKHPTSLKLVLKEKLKEQ